LLFPFLLGLLEIIGTYWFNKYLKKGITMLEKRVKIPKVFLFLSLFMFEVNFLLAQLDSTAHITTNSDGDEQFLGRVRELVSKKIKDLPSQEFVDNTAFIDLLKNILTVEDFERVLRVASCFDSTGLGIREIVVEKIVPCLCVIDSKIDAAEFDNPTLESKVDQIDVEVGIILSKICTIDSKVDIVDNIIKTTLSKVCTIDSKIDVVDNEIADLAFDFVETWTILQVIEDKVCCLAGNTITQADVGTVGFAITEAGVYTVCENIIFSPGSTNLAAITISSSDVTLNMNSRTISQGNATAGTYGIEIAASSSNVSINDGAIRNTIGDGIIVGISSTSIAISDITVDGGSDHGIHFTGPGSSDIRIENVVLTDNGTNGLNIDAATDVQVKNSVFTDNSSNGFILTAATGVLIDNSTFMNNGTNGLRSTASDDIIVKNSVFTDNSDDGAAFSIVNRICVTDSIASSNATHGFEFSGSSSNIVVLLSKAVGNGSNGFSFSNVTDSTIKQSIAKSNSGDGIRLDMVTNSEAIENISSNNASDGIQLSGSTTCVYVARNSLIENGSVNLMEDLSTGPNSILGNFAQNPTLADNYCEGLSAITTVTINQTSPFTSSPTPWDNINMIP